MARGLSGTGIQGHRYTGTMVQALVLQRQFKAGWPGMHGEWRGVWRETGWPDGCATAPPVAVAATPPARTTPGAASHAPPGTPGDG